MKLFHFDVLLLVNHTNNKFNICEHMHTNIQFVGVMLYNVKLQAGLVIKCFSNFETTLAVRIGNLSLLCWLLQDGPFSTWIVQVATPQRDVARVFNVCKGNISKLSAHFCYTDI